MAIPTYNNGVDGVSQDPKAMFRHIRTDAIESVLRSTVELRARIEWENSQNVVGQMSVARSRSHSVEYIYGGYHLSRWMH